MFRKIKSDISFKKDDVKIRSAFLGEEYEIGSWITTYPWVKMGYEDTKYQPHYADTRYIMFVNGFITGYFMVYSEINVKENAVIPKYQKELIIYDFSVDIRAYAKYSKILIDFLLKYAAYNGYYAVAVKKIEEYNLFNQFIKRHYKIKETEDKLYFIIPKPRIRSCEKYLTIYEKDNVQLENLYFLYDLNFDILKTKCCLKLNENEKIVIDRLTGLITFPSNIKINKDQVILNDVTKELIYLIIEMYNIGDIKPVNIDYEANNPNYYEADVDGLLHVSKSFNEVRNDVEYTNQLINKGYKQVVPTHLRYDMNDRAFSSSRVIYKLIK